MGGPFVVGSHHLATSLAASGCDVMHVSPPLSIAHLAQARDPFVRLRLQRWLRGGSNIAGVTDIVPFTAFPWALARTCAPLRKAYVSTMLASPTRSLGALKLEEATALVIDEPRLGDIARRTRDQIVVYRATDLYSVMRNDPSIVDAERALCERAHVLIGTSEAVATHLRRLSGRTVHVLGNGVDFAHFVRSPAGSTSAFDLPGERNQRAIYVGSFDDRFSAEAIRAVSRALADKFFILAGPGSERAAGEISRRNVVALGSVAYGELPALLHQCSVGLLPLSAEASNVGRSPMKLFEYAAAGLAVASTSSLPLRTRAIPALHVADNDTRFPAAVAAAFACSTDRAVLHAALERARREDWSAKAATLRSLIEQALTVNASASDPSATSSGGRGNGPVSPSGSHSRHTSWS